jgi:predicted ATPase
LLRRADVRLVTLTGTGGTGKTHLAVQVATEVLGHFANGVTFVNLAPISDPDLVIATIAQTLGMREVSGQSLQQTIQAALRERQQLLLLDNFEQVVRAAPRLAELLAGCPQLKLLITSRVLLHLRGEQEIAVPPLALPPTTDDRYPTTDATCYAAVQLFVQRVHDIQPMFVVTPENARAVAEICARLDGLPLAIELAAARSKLFSPQALLTRLEPRLTLLSGGARDLPARQQTMRSTIDWSYNLLGAREQMLFRRLAVFVGGCALEAAEAVCKLRIENKELRTGLRDDSLLNSQFSILNSIEVLLDNSLLRREAHSDGEARFLMYETIREYALERLEASGELAIVQRQHADYYLTLVEAAEPELTGAQAQVWLSRIEHEIDNLHAVLVWSLRAQGSAEVGLRLAAALHWFWNIQGRFLQGRAWLEEALTRGGEIALAPAAEAKALLVIGDLMELQIDAADAAPLLARSIALYRQIGDRAGEAQALMHAGRIARLRGDLAQAIEDEEQSLLLGRSLGDTYVTIYALLSLGDAELDQGNLERATIHTEHTLSLARVAQEQFGSAFALCNLGRIALAQKDYPRAQDVFEECLAELQVLGERGLAAEVQLELGRMARALDHTAQAHQLLEEALTLCRETGMQRTGVACLAELAGFAGTLGVPARAARLFGAVEALRKAARIPLAPIHRPAYERDLAAARAQLDAQAWDTAWAAGRTLTIEQAIAEALTITR